MNNNNFVLYLHIAPNGKKYFGITGQTPKQRWQNGHGYKNNDYFWRAIQKYDWNNIEHYILADNLTKEEACFFERIMIALYDTTNPNNGYNLSMGGEHGNHSERTKQKIGESNKGKCAGEKHPNYGKHLSIETRRRISESHIGICQTEESKRKISKAHTGKILSEETRRKISESERGLKNHKSRPVICMTTKHVFITATEAEKCYNTHQSSIVQCCRGKLKSSGKLPDGTKLVWRYLNHKHNNIYRISGGYFVDNEKMVRLIEESFGQTLSDEEIALLIEDIFPTDESIDYENIPDII